MKKDQPLKRVMIFKKTINKRMNFRLHYSKLAIFLQSYFASKIKSIVFTKWDPIVRRM